MAEQFNPFPALIPLRHNKEESAVIVSICKWISHLAGALGFLLSLWCAMLTVFYLGSNVAILYNLDGYKPSVFLVETLYFSKGDINRKQPGGYGAYGIVDGKKESFNLSGYLHEPILGLEDMKKYVQEGQRLDILYNPDMKIYDKRVLYPEKNFHEKYQQKKSELIKTAYVPFLLSMAICFVFGIFGRVFKSCIQLLAASTFILFLSWIPTVIQLIF